MVPEQLFPFHEETCYPETLQTNNFLMTRHTSSKFPKKVKSSSCHFIDLSRRVYRNTFIALSRKRLPFNRMRLSIDKMHTQSVQARWIKKLFFAVMRLSGRNVLQHWPHFCIFPSIKFYSTLSLVSIFLCQGAVTRQMIKQ